MKLFLVDVDGLDGLLDGRVELWSWALTAAAVQLTNVDLKMR